MYIGDVDQKLHMPVLGQPRLPAIARNTALTA